MATVPKLEVRVKPHVDKSNRATRCLAYVELTIGDSFVIKGIRILQHTHRPDDGAPFVVFPATKRVGVDANRWFDVAHPVTPEARAAALDLIMYEYAKLSGTP